VETLLHSPTWKWL